MIINNTLLYSWNTREKLTKQKNWNCWQINFRPLPSSLFLSLFPCLPPFLSLPSFFLLFLFLFHISENHIVNFYTYTSCSSLARNEAKISVVEEKY